MMRLSRFFAVILLVAKALKGQYDWERLNPAVVKIMDSQRNTSGTGFVVGSYKDGVFILTAYHVVNDILMRNSSLFSQFQGADPFQVVLLNQTEPLPGRDLAILVGKPPKAISIPKLLIGNTTALKVGQPVTAIGHPFGYEWQPAINNEILIKSLGPENRWFAFKNVGTNEGNSGGPVFTATGELVGMAQQRTDANTIAIRVDEIGRILKTWKIDANNMAYPYERSLAQAKKFYTLKDYKNAYAVFEKAAGEGSSEAKLWLGLHSKEGPELKSNADRTAAALWLQKAADDGYPEAMRVLAGRLESTDPKRAWELLLKAANQDNTEAMVEVAQRLQGTVKEKNPTVTVDPPQALNWLVRASSNGSAFATLEIGRAYEEGLGVTPDINKACEWYKKSTSMSSQTGGRGPQTRRTVEQAMAEAFANRATQAFNRACATPGGPGKSTPIPARTVTTAPSVSSSNGALCAAIRGAADAGRNGYANLRVPNGPAYVANIELPGIGQVNYKSNKAAWAILREGGKVALESATSAKSRVQAMADTLGSCFPSAKIVAANRGSCAIGATDVGLAVPKGLVSDCWNLVGPEVYGTISVVSIKREFHEITLGSKTKPTPFTAYTGYLFFVPDRPR